jgi:hypothetical protein
MQTLKKRIFYSLLVIIPLATTIALFEMAYPFAIKQKQKILKHLIKLDYPDAMRTKALLPENLGPGGYLKENFRHFMFSGYGNPVWWENNAQGFRYNRNIEMKPSKGVIRILSIGDSYTVGYRLGLEQTFSHKLEAYFNRKNDGHKYEIPLSCIDEPVSSISYLRNFGVQFKPDVVIFGITVGNDITQVYTRLGSQGTCILNDATLEIAPNPKAGPLSALEKHIPSECLVQNESWDYGTVKEQSGKDIFFKQWALWKMLSEMSKEYEGETVGSIYPDETPRLFDWVNGIGLYLKDPPGEIREAYECLFRVLKGLKVLSQRYSFKLVVVIFPERIQVQKKDWRATIQRYRLKEDCFNLTTPNDLIMDFCKKNDIYCLDPTLQMKASHERIKRNFYFSLSDMHWNALGNSALFESIKDRIYQIINN